MNKCCDCKWYWMVTTTDNKIMLTNGCDWAEYNEYNHTRIAKGNLDQNSEGNCTHFEVKDGH